MIDFDVNKKLKSININLCKYTSLIKLFLYFTPQKIVFYVKKKILSLHFLGGEEKEWMVIRVWREKRLFFLEKKKIFKKN